MRVTDITIKRIAAQVKEEANMYARGGEWDWKKVEDLLREIATMSAAEKVLDIADERANRE